MRKLSLVVIGVALAVTVAACDDVPAPRGQEGGGEGLEEAPSAEPIAAPTDIEKGVVPDVVQVIAGEAQEAVEKAGFVVVWDSEGLAFTQREPNAKNDLVCSQDPPGGESPPKGSDVTLVFDRKCSELAEGGGAEES